MGPPHESFEMGIKRFRGADFDKWLLLMVK